MSYSNTLPSLMQMAGGEVGEAELPAAPPTPSDLGYGEESFSASADFTNPIADEPTPRIEGEEPGLLGEALGQSPGGILPEGPEAEMDQSARDDMLDMLQQRAKARAARSDYFQQQARAMAAKHF